MSFARREKKDLRTLLFCKLPTVASFQKLDELAAKQLAPAEGNNLWKMYYAFGGYNALCVYPIPPVERADDNDPSWLSTVYQDKQKFAANVTDGNLVCHQMHLISQNDNSEFWNEDERYPFFFVTLVYGVVHPSKDEYKEEKDGYCSFYERRVAQYLQEYEKREEKIKAHCLFAIYNGINIGDAVIFWKSNDIEKTLSLISELGYGNIARKTLTTIALPISPRGKLSPAALNRLENGRADSELVIIMRGTVKDAKQFDSFIEKIQNPMPNEDGPYALSLNPGKYDFTLSRKVTTKGLTEFLNGVLWKYDELIQDACWETHINLLIPKRKLAEQEPKTTVLTPVITQLYKQFLEIYKLQMWRHRYSWWNSLLEQYSTQYYIDRHPTLHGPGYLVYQSLHILNGYLAELPIDSLEDNFASLVIRKSEANINHYISCLNLLMDQITHNDNAMISGYPNVHAILFSLPESILDFYHAFLRVVVEVLICFDRLKNRIPDNFEYDFLFTPQQGPRFRFCPVINAEIDLHASENSAKVWPARQAYVLEVPLKSLFEPMGIFPPMVHECFHCFGDELRKREKRKQYMSHFLATTIVTALGFGRADYAKVEQAVQEYLLGNDGTNETKELYLLAVVQQFEKQLQKLFSQTKAIDEVFERSNNTAYCLYANDTMTSLRNMALSYDSGDNHGLVSPSVLRACKYYFKECYADTMTIALLKLSPMEYLTLIQGELEFLADEKSSSQNELATALAQRFAIVLAACNCSQLLDDWSIDRISTEVEQFKINCGNQNGVFFKSLNSYFKELVGKGDHSKGFMINGMDNLPKAAFPPAALYAVVQYLLECIRVLNNIPGGEENLGGELAEAMRSLRSDFNQIIRDGDMFSQRFYELIYQQHQKIRNAVM